MRRASLVLLPLVSVMFLSATLAASGKRSDASGTWNWTQTRPDGQTISITATLKQDGGKLTGTFHGKGSDSAIYDGAINGDEVKFSVDREIDGHDITLKYSGKIDGDAIKGEVNMKAGFRTRKADWEAKRGAT